MTKTLLVLPDLPFPPTSGLHQRMIGALDILTRLGHETTVLYFSADEPGRDEEALAARCDDVVCGGARRPYGSITWRHRALQRIRFLTDAALGRRGRAYPFSVRYDLIGAKETVVRVSQSIDAEVVVLPSLFLHYAKAVKSTGAAVVIDAADVLTDLSWGFVRYGRRQPWRVPGLVINHLSCRALERNHLSDADEVWATTELEAERFRALSSGCKVIVVPNTIQDDGPPRATSPRPRSFGFLATYTYLPNLEALLILADRVLPLVRALVSDARLVIGGGGLTNEQIEMLSAKEGVEVLGRVESSAAFFDDLEVVCMPIKVRGGVPLKLVEAMSRSKAVVASPELVAGLPVADGIDILIAGDDQLAADQVIRLFHDAGLREQIGASARRFFEAHHSLDGTLERVGPRSILGPGSHSEEKL